MTQPEMMGLHAGIVLTVGEKRIALLYAIDVGSTNEAYARLVFEMHHADELIIMHPYTGISEDVLGPFAKYGKPIYIAVWHSDPDHMRNWLTEAGIPVWKVLAINCQKVLDIRLSFCYNYSKEADKRS